MALEALCAAKAAERITDDEAAQLRELGGEPQARGRGREPAEVLRAQPGAAPPGRGHLRADRRGRPARAAARAARQAPVPARAAARPARGVAVRAPGHRSTPSPAGGPRTPTAPSGAHLASVIEALQADNAAVHETLHSKNVEGAWLPMLNVIVTDPPRADLAEVDKLAEYGVATVHEAIGRNGYLGPEHPAEPAGHADRGHRAHRAVLAGRQPDDPRRRRAGQAGRHHRDHHRRRRRATARSASCSPPRWSAAACAAWSWARACATPRSCATWASPPGPRTCPRRAP